MCNRRHPPPWATFASAPGRRQQRQVLPSASITPATPTKSERRPTVLRRRPPTFALLTWRGLSAREGGLLRLILRSTSWADLVGLVPRSASAASISSRGTRASGVPLRCSAEGPASRGGLFMHGLRIRSSASFLGTTPGGGRAVSRLSRQKVFAPGGAGKLQQRFTRRDLPLLPTRPEVCSALRRASCLCGREIEVCTHGDFFKARGAADLKTMVPFDGPWWILRQSGG